MSRHAATIALCFIFVSAAPAAAAGERPAAPADCKPSAGIEPLLAGQHLLLVGEIHGTVESPGFVGETVCAALAKGRTVTAGLEIPAAEQARLDAFLGSAGAAADRDGLLAGDFWRDPYQDGRRSEAMLGLLERLRAFRRAGLPVAVLAIDPPPGTPAQERERGMAERLRAAIAAAPGDMFVVLTGDFHTRIKRGAPWDEAYEEMGLLLRRALPSLRLTALDVAYTGGSAWICQTPEPAGCKPATLNGKGSAAKGHIVTFRSLDDNGYTGQYGVGQITPSPPAFRPLTAAPAPGR